MQLSSLVTSRHWISEKTETDNTPDFGLWRIAGGPWTNLSLQIGPSNSSDQSQLYQTNLRGAHIGRDRYISKVAAKDRTYWRGIAADRALRMYVLYCGSDPTDQIITLLFVLA
jgi:hypothetical protein